MLRHPHDTAPAVGAGLAFLLAAMMALAASAAFAATDVPPFPADPPAAAPNLGDRDADRVSDALAAKIAQQGTGARFEVIVTFDGPGNVASARAAAGPFRVIRELGLVRGFLAEMTGGQVLGLSRDNGVFRIEENVQVTAVLDNTRADYRADDARNAGYDGFGIGACIIDTGGDSGHVDIAPQVPADGFCNALTGGCNVDASGNALPDAPSVAAFDDHSHGTHVGGIVAGAGIGNLDYAGVAPGATLYFAKVLDSNGSGSLADVEKGMNWCAGHPDAQVLNLSLGSSGNGDGNSALERALDCVVDNTANASCNPSYSGRSPKLVVVAMGNAGPGSGTVGIPAAARNAISVGASAPASVVADFDNGAGLAYAPYSSRGPTADGRVKPEIMAPGSGITAPKAGTTSEYVTYSGTSMASPYIAGTVALMLDARFGAEGRPANDSLTTADIAAVRAALLSSAEDIGPAGQDNESGHGVVDTWRAVSLATGGAELDPGPNPFIVSSVAYSAAIPDNKDWRQTYVVQPGEAITVSLLSPFECAMRLLGVCFIFEFSDFDARLWNGSTLVDMSQCYDGEPKGNSGVGDTDDPTATYCGASSGYGRQDTLHAANDTGAAISYEVEVFPWNGDANDSVNRQTVDIVVTVTRPGAAAPSNQLPTAVASASPAAAETGATIQVDSAGSGDPDGSITSYAWAFASKPAGSVASFASPSSPSTNFTADQAGAYEVRLTVTDNAGGQGTGTVSVMITDPPPADVSPPVVSINSPTTDQGRFATDNPKLDLAGTASDNVGVTQVTWSNSRGGGGAASGTVNWSVSGIALQGGDNDITVTALDGALNAGVAILTVTYTPPDPTSQPPAAPTDLLAALQTSGNGRNKVVTVTLSWSDNSDNEDFFLVERCAETGKGKDKTCSFGEIGSTGADTNTFADSPGSGTFRYRVRARNGAGDSAYSNEVKI